ncbi:MAG TPA: hypothetical protein VII42_15295 [Caulobacteraceae bacterium]
MQRCRLEGGGLPETVIVKWLRDDGQDIRVDPRQVATEQAALAFLSSIGFAAAPRLIAADRDAGVLVLEDLAPRIPLADLIRSQGAVASTTELMAFARLMGELGAATVGKAAAYDAIRSRYGAPEPRAGRERGLGPDWAAALAQLDALGLTMSAAVERDLASLVEALLNPGPFLAFSNGDPETNNVLVDGADGRLIDFEGAAFRHALTSAVWMHVPGPAWITVTLAIGADLEAAYRQALAAGVAEAEDDRLFGFGMAAACLGQACDRLSRFPSLDRRPPGDARIQMVSTLQSAAAVARRHRSLPHLAGWVEGAAQWLRRRWPDADVDFSRYPPYTPRT